MHTAIRSLTIFVLAGACALAHAATQEAAPAGFAQARSQFMAGTAGDATARDAAREQFKALAASYPGHPLLAAYAGAAVALQGRDASMPWEKMKYSEAGANAIEKALAQLTPAHDEALFEGAPESVVTRLVAASTLLALPDFMNRRAGGKRALDAALTSPVLAQAPAGVRAALLEVAARQAGRDKRGTDETSLLQQLIKTAPQSPEAQRAAARLKELGQ